MDHIFIKKTNNGTSTNSKKSSANQSNPEKDKLKFAKLFNMAGALEINSNQKQQLIPNPKNRAISGET